MNGLRIFATGGLLSYRALFNWRHPAVYIPTMLGKPVFQIVFFTFLGRFSGVADDRYFIVGGAVQASAIAGVFGMAMSLANEREFGTLASVLATPAPRAPLFFGRTLPIIANGVFISTVVLAAGFVGLGLRIPVAALPAVAAAVVVTATSGVMFGLALGSVSMRVRDLWVGSNLAYALMLLLCGSAVPRSALPAWLAAAGQVLPFTHGIAAARAFAAGTGGAAGQLGVEALVGLGYAVLGYGLLRVFELESRRRATLDQR
jgi:ABC-2 type transport system permease protein